MRYSTFFKLIAIVLCAAALLGMVGSAAGLMCLAELGDKSVHQQYQQQLYNRALNYGTRALEIFVSEDLGAVPRNAVNQYWGNDWENGYFDWTKAGYTIYDGEGNVLQEKEIPDSSGNLIFKEKIPVGGQYMKIISAKPYDQNLVTEPEVTLMPSQESTAIGAVFVDYTDGYQEAWPGDGTQLGALRRSESGMVFISNIGEFPMGDGWYPNHILMLDMGGNAVYEAAGDNLVLGSSEDEYGIIRIQLPAGTVTTAALAGISYEDGDYWAYDAIPAQGMTVSSMQITYADRWGKTQGSEGISSPDILGTLFHDQDGNAVFVSKEAMSMDIPGNCVIAGVAFWDMQGRTVFNAGCPGGVGEIFHEETGKLIFQGRMPGTKVPEETAAPVPMEEQQRSGFARETLTVYSAPSTEAAEVGTVDAWEELQFEALKTFDGIRWGLISDGWILMDGVLMEENAVSFTRQNAENDTEQSEPQETEAVTEVTLPQPVEAAVNEEDQPFATIRYYDSELRQEMVAEYVMEPIPAGYTVEVCLAQGALRDEFAWMLMHLAEQFRHLLVEILGISMAVFALCVVHLCCSAGRTRRNNEVRAGGLNRIPLDLYFVGDCCVGTGLLLLIIEGVPYLARNDGQLALTLFGACAYFLALLAVGFFFAFVAQIKTPGGYWWRNTLCSRCVRQMIRGCTAVFDLGIKVYPKIRTAGKKTVLWLWDAVRKIAVWAGMLLKNAFRWTTSRLARFFGMLPVTWQFLVTGFSLVVLLYMMMRTYKVGYILLGFGIFFAAILYAASAFAILLENAKRMTKGDLDTKVDDKMLIGGFKEFAEKLNDLAGVAAIAAQKQLKSERMKTELITNVSHDIKTPLTSIINYVDLLKKPHTDQQQEQYLEVLDRQSQRLKKLIDDLMEMSKASTGNMTVEIQRMDAGETVNQALGEFAEKLEKAQLTVVFRQPEEPVYMMADGRLVWRILSNILGNAVKYALPGTRVYLDLMELEDKVIISMKNISREELNVQADELLERFVRGDASRNTEGSGLGLNIAQSLMELQKGKLQVLVDGDLFKVTLIFPGI